MNEHHNHKDMDAQLQNDMQNSMQNGSAITGAGNNGATGKKSARGRNAILAALDIGTDKIACFIATHNPKHPPAIKGIGLHAASGMRGGEVVDAEALAIAVGRAVEQAEHMAGLAIEHVWVSLGGGGLQSEIRRHEVAVGMTGRITERDIVRVLRPQNHTATGHAVADGDTHDDGSMGGGGDEAHALAHENMQTENRPENREVVHAIPIQFLADGVGGIRDAVGLHASTLGVDLAVVTARTGTLRNLEMVVEQNHLKIKRFCASAYAASLAVLVRDEKELGAMVIEMGAGTTGVTVFRNGHFVYCDAIDIGGGHVTSDIARGLSTPASEAERIKTLHGNMLAAIGDTDTHITLPRIGGDDIDTSQQIELGLIGEIVRPRIEETFEILFARMQKAGFGSATSGRIILTGGGAQLPGLCEYLGRLLDRPVRVGRPAHITGLADAVSGTPYAATAGLLHFAAFEHGREPGREYGRHQHRPAHKTAGGFLWRLGEWFNTHI